MNDSELYLKKSKRYLLTLEKRIDGISDKLLNEVDSKRADILKAERNAYLTVYKELEKLIKG